MQNDPDLMDFATWRAEQPDSEDSGLVLAANDHASKSCSVWWAGPETGFLRRMQAEAHARGIKLIVRHAKYSKPEIKRAADLIFEGRATLERAGFELAAVAGPGPEFHGLTVVGAPLRDENAQQLTPALVAAARDAVAVLLGETAIPATDVQIEYGRTHLF